MVFTIAWVDPKGDDGQGFSFDQINVPNRKVFRAQIPGSESRSGWGGSDRAYYRMGGP